MTVYCGKCSKCKCEVSFVSVFLQDRLCVGCQYEQQTEKPKPQTQATAQTQSLSLPSCTIESLSIEQFCRLGLDQVFLAKRRLVAKQNFVRR